MVGRHFVHSQKIAVRYIGRESADSRSIYRSRFLSVCIVFSPLSIALEKKLEQDYWNINRLPPLTRGDSWKIRIFGHFSVSYESKLLKIKHESMLFFAIASRFVTFFGTGMPKSLTQSLSTFRFSLFSCFCHFASSETQGQSVGLKRRDESFQAWAEEPLGTDSHGIISKRSRECCFLIGHKKCFVLLCPIG